MTIVPVLTQVSLGPIQLPPSLETTISVTLGAMCLATGLASILTTHCGMVMGVALLAVAVSSTPLHGSVNLYFNPPQMTWRYNCVTISLEVALTKLSL